MPGSLQAVRHLHFHGEGPPFRRSRASSPKGEPLGAAGNFAAAEAFTRRGKVARSAGWGQHPLALLRPLSQALSGLPALPKGEPRALPETLSLPLKAVPLRADFPRPGEDVAQRQKGECGIAAGDDGRGNHQQRRFLRKRGTAGEASAWRKRAEPSGRELAKPSGFDGGSFRVISMFCTNRAFYP